MPRASGSGSSRPAESSSRPRRSAVDVYRPDKHTHGTNGTQTQFNTQHRYAPVGNPQEKRKLRSEYRTIIESTQRASRNPNDLKTSDLTEVLDRGGSLFARVEAPSESVLDSRLLMTASEMGAALAKNMRVGSEFDVDEFMRRACHLVGGQLRNRANVMDEEDDEDAPNLDADGWKWDKLGLLAAKHSRRAITMDHLLGPLMLSHEKRTQKQRAVADKTGPAVKPQELRAEDIVSTENETASLVRHIAKQLNKYNTPDEEGQSGINLFEFAIDPDSFSNTVENLFHISFLIREGTASIDMGDGEQGEPILMSCEAATDDQHAQGVMRRQIVLELDQRTWRGLVETYDIREAKIKHTRTHQKATDDTWSSRPNNGARR